MVVLGFTLLAPPGPRLRRRITLLHPAPLPPATRSPYGFENQLNNAIRTDAMTRKYLRSTKEQKQRMYAQLLETLENNGDNPDHLENLHI